MPCQLVFRLVLGFGECAHLLIQLVLGPRLLLLEVLVFLLKQLAGPAQSLQLTLALVDLGLQLLPLLLELLLLGSDVFLEEVHLLL